MKISIMHATMCVRISLDIYLYSIQCVIRKMYGT